MKYLIALFLLSVVSITLQAQDLAGLNTEEILKVRSSSNQAFAEHQIEEVVSYLTEDCNIAASNGQIIAGKKAFQEALAQTFSMNSDLYFVRNAEEVLVNTENTIAWEKGAWQAFRPETADWKSYGGSYSAYWVKLEGVWKIKSELFVRLF